MIVTCNRCGKEFPNMLKEETKQVDGFEIIITYQECPYCGEVFPCYVDTAETVSMKKQIRKQREAYKTLNSPKQKAKKFADIKKKQKRLRDKMCRLEAKYLKTFMEEKNNGRTESD